MKKKLYLLLTFILILFTSSCSCKDNRIDFKFGDYDATTYITLTNDELNEKIANKDSFALFIYQDGCAGCARFKPILNEVITNNHYIVYAINCWYIDNNEELTSVLKYTPSMVAYENGELKKLFDPDNMEDYFVDTDGLDEFFDEYYKQPFAYLISSESLVNKATNNEDFIVYYIKDRTVLNELKEEKEKYYILITNENDLSLIGGVNFDSENKYIIVKYENGIPIESTIK